MLFIKSKCHVYFHMRFIIKAQLNAFIPYMKIIAIEEAEFLNS